MGRPKLVQEKPFPTCLSNQLKSAQDKERYAKYFFTPATRAIRDLIVTDSYKRIDMSMKKCDNPDKFAHPAWSEYQAAGVGYRQALRDIIEILER